MRKPSVTAGLKCPPEMCPRAVTMIARMRPWATATPRRSPPPVITEPAPTKISANAPTNSATDRRRFSPSTAGSLGPAPDRLGGLSCQGQHVLTPQQVDDRGAATIDELLAANGLCRDISRSSLQGHRSPAFLDETEIRPRP